MPIKTPKAYEVENYEVGSYFAGLRRLSDNQNLTNETKHTIAQAISADLKFQEKKGEYQVKQDQYNLDLQWYEELKTKKVLGKMTPEDLQMLTELKSKLEVWVIPQIFEWKIQDKLTGTMNEWKLNFNGKEYTFVRKEWILKSFEQMGMEVKDFKNWTEVTVYLKELFADYTDQYPELFAMTNRFHIRNYEQQCKKFPMISKWAQDNNIPYAGLQASDGDHYWTEGELCAWLPMRVKGKFVFALSRSRDKEAHFDWRNEDEAQLSVSFTN